jgi:hypothetical protein
MRHSAAFLILLIGCEDTAPTPQSCSGMCVSDPVGHCITQDGCTSDLDCPSGLTCGPELAESVCSTEPGMRCRWRRQEVNRLALIEGFHADSMETRVVNDPQTQFQWNAPSNAKYIACAVFSCNPVVLPRIGSSESDRPAVDSYTDAGVESNSSLLANAPACVLHLQLTGAARQTLPISAGIPRLPGAVCTPQGTYTRVMEFLAGACWAYDDFHIIAASELVRIDPATLVDGDPRIPTDARCLNPGDECYADGYFGRCVGTECMPRCMTPQDCEAAATVYLKEPASPTCRWECPKPFPSDSLVGVCQRVP